MENTSASRSKSIVTVAHTCAISSAMSGGIGRFAT
jgi:hypothetical protein